MVIGKIKDFDNSDDEKFIKAKVNKMMYFYPKKLKKNSRKDYRKKISLAYRILEAHPSTTLSVDGLETRLNEAFKALGSKKEKYLKDIFHKLLKFEKFKETEPNGDYPAGSESEGEEPKTHKDRAWRDLRRAILKQAYEQFTNKYRDPNETDELKLENDSKISEDMDEK